MKKVTITMSLDSVQDFVPLSVNKYYEAKIHCPKCGEQHIDEGEFARRLHHKHLCTSCGHVWRLEEFVFGV